MYKELDIPNIFTMEASFCGADKGQYKDSHFTTEAYTNAGQKLLEALLVAHRIPVKHDPTGPPRAYEAINALELEQELSRNKKLISMTMGEEGGSSGSESEPSADNVDEEEMAKILPVKAAKKPGPKKEDKKPAPAGKRLGPIGKKPQSPVSKRPPPMVKELSRSPQKRPAGYNPFDRLSLRKLKPDMKDAWT